MATPSNIDSEKSIPVSLWTPGRSYTMGEVVAFQTTKPPHWTARLRNLIVLLIPRRFRGGLVLRLGHVDRRFYVAVNPHVPAGSEPTYHPYWSEITPGAIPLIADPTTLPEP
jgi:hypothetical protein